MTMAAENALVPAAEVSVPRPSWLDSRNAAAWLLLLPALSIIVAFFAYPVTTGLVQSLTDTETGAFSIAHYHAMLTDPEQLATIGKTFRVALPVTFLSVILAVPLAYWMRRGIRFERLVTTLLILPMTLGTVLVSLGMLSYFGRQGWFNQILIALHVVDKAHPLALTYNYLGVQLGLFIQGFPFVFLMILGYMSGINPALERSARMLGATQFQTFRRIILPLAAPGIWMAFALGFVANFSVFPTAVLVGQPMGETRTLAIAAYEAAFEYYDFTKGNVLAFTMGAIQLGIVAAIFFLRSRGYRGQGGIGGKG